MSCEGGRVPLRAGFRRILWDQPPYRLLRRPSAAILVALSKHSCFFTRIEAVQEPLVESKSILPREVRVVAGDIGRLRDGIEDYFFRPAHLAAHLRAHGVLGVR